MSTVFSSFFIFLVFVLLIYIIYIYYKHTTKKPLEQHEHVILIKVSNITDTVIYTSVSLLNSAIVNVSNMSDSLTKKILSTVIPSVPIPSPYLKYNNVLSLPKAMYPLTSYYDEDVSTMIINEFDIKDRQRIDTTISIPKPHSMPCYDDEVVINGLCYKQCPTYTYDNNKKPTSCVYNNPKQVLRNTAVPENSSIRDVSNIVNDMNVSFHLPPCSTDENIINGICFKQCKNYSFYDNIKNPTTCTSII